MVKQQREINSTLQSQAAELQAVEQEVADVYDQWLERQGTKVRIVQLLRRRRIKGM